MTKIGLGWKIFIVFIALGFFAFAIVSMSLLNTLTTRDVAASGKTAEVASQVAKMAEAQTSSTSSEKVTNEVPPSTSSNAPVVALPNPADFDSAVFIKGAMPMYQDLRTHVRQPGDTSSFLITFTVDFPSLTLQRLVADDVLTEATYFSSPSAVGINIMPLLQMGPVTISEPADPDLRSYLKSRGVNVEVGEILAQNYQSVFLGGVKTGAYIIVKFKDDPKLQVNSGGLISFSADTDKFTVDLAGKLIANPTFVVEKK